MYQCTERNANASKLFKIFLLPEAICCCLKSCMLNVLVGIPRFIVIGHRYILASNAHKYLPVIMYCLGHNYMYMNWKLT